MTAPRAAATESRQDRDRRKREGVFYTPEPVARYMVTATLRGTLGCCQPSTRIVDPACGDGALLWPAYQFLCHQQQASNASQRLDIVRQQLFGVDLDEQALERLRQRFRDELADEISSSELNDVLERNFRCGNAVTGNGWEVPSSSAKIAQSQDIFHWSEQFPEVHAAGGFDVVIANPPYRRERGAKSDLQELEQSPLARSRQQARMDLWHYFFHRSLDLLRPGGLLTFIVNSYWTTSHAGRPLIERMRAETTPLEFVLLDTAPVFAGVAGRHVIVQLRKGLTSEPCRVVTLSASQQSAVLEAGLWNDLAGEEIPKSESSRVLDPVAWQSLTRDELFYRGRLNLGPHVVRPRRSTSSTKKPQSCLGDVFEVRQGIAENPPRVTRRQAENNSDLHRGEGVFVLSADELALLDLSPLELELVRPYYAAVEIARFWTPPPPRQWLLYLTRQTAPDLSCLPKIERHLARFRTLLEQRRETHQGKVAWWHLHWPRESRLFECPRILAVQMAQEPRFAYVESPTYVGFSVNVIVARPASQVSDIPRLPLEALAVILNSGSAATWFDAHAKRRGIKLDITGSALKSFPLPEVTHSVANELVRLGILRGEIELRRRMIPTMDVRDQVQAIEEQINELTDSLSGTPRQ